MRELILKYHTLIGVVLVLLGLVSAAWTYRITYLVTKRSYLSWVSGRTAFLLTLTLIAWALVFITI